MHINTDCIRAQDAKMILTKMSKGSQRRAHKGRVSAVITVFAFEQDLLFSIITLFLKPLDQAHSLGGFEGVRTNPPCSLAKFIFNETAAVQGTIIQPCSGIVTDSIQAIMELLHGVVTYTSPVEAFATGIKHYDR